MADVARTLSLLPLALMIGVPEAQSMTTTAPQPTATRSVPDPAAVAHFRAKLQFETDPSDVYAAMCTGQPVFVLLDSRGDAAWQQGRIPGAVHLPTAQIPARAGELLDRGVPVVAYCWGPGCNGSTRAALALAQLGYQVQELIGGFEYWSREGLPVQTDDGTTRRAPDPLTTPVRAPACDC